MAAIHDVREVTVGADRLGGTLPARGRSRNVSSAAISEATTATAAEGDLSIDVVADLEALEALGPDWRALEKLAPAAAVFQSHAQMLIWARRMLPKGGRRLHVLGLRDRGSLCLVLPLFVTRSAGISIAAMAGTPIAQYSEMLADPSGPLERYFGAALKRLRLDGVDLLRLDGVRADSILLRSAGPSGRPPLDKRIAPYADLLVAGDHESFVRKRSKNLLHGLRNRKKQLARTNTLGFDVIEGGPAARDALHHAIGLKREWLVHRGAVSAAFLDPATTECLLDLAEHCPGATVMRMLVDGEPAAIRFGFEHLGTYFAYLSAYDASLSQFAPGKLLLDYCFATMRERGNRVIDMLPPAGEHKKDWCTDAADIADYRIPLSLKGRLYSGLMEEKLRPAVDWTWHHLPAPVRARIAPLFLSM